MPVPVYQRQVGSEPMPDVRYDGVAATGAALVAMGSMLGRAAGRFEAIHQDEALEHARVSAIEVVNNSRTFDPVRQGGAYWRQYNKAGLAAYAQEIELTARQNVARIALEHRNDPKAMEGALASYSAGVRSTLPTEMQRGYAKDFEVWSRPHINAALERSLDLANRNAKGSLTALMEQRAVDARTVGAVIGAADLTSPAGQQSIASATAGLSELYHSTVDHLQDMVDSGQISLGEAEAAIQTQRAEITTNLLMGAFDAAPDKEAFLLDFVEGKLQIPVPQIVPGGDPKAVGDDRLAFPMGKPIDALGIKAFDELRSHFATRVSAVRSAATNAREATNAATEADGKALLAQFAATRDPRLLDLIEAHPGLTLDQKGGARRMMRDEGAEFTDWTAFENISRQIDLAPHTVTDMDIRTGPYARTEEAALFDRLNKRREQDHFANSEPFQQAETRIDRVVGQISTDVIAVTGGTSADATSSRIRASALLKQRLYDVTRGMLEQGFEIGPTGNGKSTETVGDIRRFDPEVWAREKVAALRARAKADVEPVNLLRDQIQKARQEQIAARTAGDAVKANEIGQRIIDLQRQIRDARNALDLSNLIMEEEIVR